MLFLLSLHSKSILVASQKWSWATDVTWTVLPMSSVVSESGNISVVLLSMQGQRALRFLQNILICVPKMNEGLMGLEWNKGE